MEKGGRETCEKVFPLGLLARRCPQPLARPPGRGGARRGAGPGVGRGHSRVGGLLGPAHQREGQRRERWSPEGAGAGGWSLGCGLPRRWALSGGLLRAEEKSCHQSQNTGLALPSGVLGLVSIPSVLPWAPDIGSGAENARLWPPVCPPSAAVRLRQLHSSHLPSAPVDSPFSDRLPSLTLALSRDWAGGFSLKALTGAPAEREVTSRPPVPVGAATRCLALVAERPPLLPPAPSGSRTELARGGHPEQGRGGRSVLGKARGQGDPQKAWGGGQGMGWRPGLGFPGLRPLKEGRGDGLEAQMGHPGACRDRANRGPCSGTGLGPGHSPGEGWCPAHSLLRLGLGTRDAG